MNFSEMSANERPPTVTERGDNEGLNIDFQQLTNTIHLFTQKLDVLNKNSKENKLCREFLINNQQPLLNLFEKTSTCFNTIKKLKRKKRKLEQSDFISERCEMASKKLKEKHIVVSKLDTKYFAHKNNFNFEATTATTKTTPEDKNENKGTKVDFTILCYICKERFDTVHFFYHKLCPKCAKLNYEKRQQKCDFTGKIAVVTGCRIKIGYEICLYLLRNGCKVIGTSRFAKDAFMRYAKEPDFESFKHLLVIYPLDLRNLNAIDKFISYLYETQTHLDILINNAAQTLRRNVQFYKHLMDIEAKPFESFDDTNIYQILPSDKLDLWSANHETSHDLKVQLSIKDSEVSNQVTEIQSAACNISTSAYHSQIPVLPDDFNPDLNNFPQDTYDKDLQQVDLSKKSSWKLQIDEINIFEFAETQFINAWAPFILCSKLKNLMSKGTYEARYIVNVSSMEGKFNRSYKSSHHSHTNMSKAALNMLTRTCGQYFATSNIYLTSVDTGWVSEMNPNALYDFKRTVPLDEIDGAIRVLDPIIQGINNKNYFHSIFLKDYKRSEW